MIHDLKYLLKNDVQRCRFDKLVQDMCKLFALGTIVESFLVAQKEYSRNILIFLPWHAIFRMLITCVIYLIFALFLCDFVEVSCC